jgi:probable phosphoglycerate mutase
VTTRLVLVRHGEAQAAVDQVIGGHTGCTGLSDLGRRQATALRNRWLASGALRSATALYASALPRAIETAEIIGAAVGNGDLEVVSDCDLCEVHPGDELDGRPIADAADRWRVLASDVYGVAGGSHESWAEFVFRTNRRLLRIAHDHPDETVVVACHGGVVEASFRGLGGHGVAERLTAEVDNTSVTEWQSVRRALGWALVRFNDAAHLEGLT